MDRVWREINLNNLQYNLNVVKKYAEGKNIICMVKDNAYGHGCKAVSLYLEKDEKVVAFAVASIDEAMILVNAKIKKDIIIISHIDKEDYEVAIKNDLIITVSTKQQSVDIDKTAKMLNKVAKIQIAIDTGMNRIGFDTSEKSIKEIIEISKMRNIDTHGIFSHFSVADSDEKNIENETFTKEQEKAFANVVEALKKEGIKSIDTSIANSAGVLSKLGLNCTSVRPGIILYGILPSERFSNIKLKPILELKSRIIYIHNIKKGTSVSYGRDFISNKDMTIATISCGYGDGYPRSASNKMCVLINDKRCRVLGKIAMDMMMVDVSDINCKINDEVILIGKSKSDEITLNELCDTTGEFTYELLTRINNRVVIYSKEV